MTFSRLHRLLTAAIIVAALAIVGCSSPKNEYITVEGEALGTFVMVKCNTTLSEEDIALRIMGTDNQMKASMSIFDETSLLSQINRNETCELDEHLIYNIKLAERFYTLSGGAYDITVKPLTDVWGFGRNTSTSTPNIDSILQFVGYDRIAIEGNRLVKQDSRTQIDLNSIAKGYTVDVVGEELEALGIVDYIVNIGGEIRCRGRNAVGKLWTIGIETPYDGNMAMDSIEKIISVDNGALATSGNYRRFYVNDNDEKITHTIDPRTGYSVSSTLLSATVVAPSCAGADAAATMFMALGSEGGAVEKAKECEERFGWKYYFIFADGDGYAIECSEEYK
jgi:thiamine biosynthesis lipoprotein